MNRNVRLGFEALDNKVLLSSNPWYIDSIHAPEAWNISNGAGYKPVVAIVDSGEDYLLCHHQ